VKTPQEFKNFKISDIEKGVVNVTILNPNGDNVVL